MRFIVWRGRRIGRQQWRWTLIGANNRKLAVGGEAFVNRDDLLASLEVAWQTEIDWSLGSFVSATHGLLAGIPVVVKG